LKNAFGIECTALLSAEGAFTHASGAASVDVLRSRNARAGQSDGASGERVTDTAIKPLVVRLEP
jgi:hypothetical protein